MSARFFCGGFGADLRAPKNGADSYLKERICRTANFPNGGMAFCRIVEFDFGKNEIELGRRPHFCGFRKGRAGLKCPAEAGHIMRIVQGAAQAWTHQKTSGGRPEWRAGQGAPRRAAGMGMRGRQGMGESSKGVAWLFIEKSGQPPIVPSAWKSKAM